MLKDIFLFSLIAVLLGIYFAPTQYFSSLYKNLFMNVEDSVSSSTRVISNKRLISPRELKLYNGIDKPLLYLALLGNIFDVTKGEQHYGPEKPYNFFVGKDASKNFITGKFTKEDLSEEVTGLSFDELRSLKNWLKFYSTEYTKVGKLIGKYYDENGKLTAYGREVKKLIKKAEEAKEAENLSKQRYPPCNVEWNPVKGSRVWCTTKSGGIERHWIGKPRQYYEPGSTNFRCACVQDTETDSLGNIKEYDGCDSNADSCFVKEND